MKNTLTFLAAAVCLLLLLNAAVASAQPPGAKRQMTKSQVKSKVSNYTRVRRTQAQVTKTKQAMDALADTATGDNNAANARAGVRSIPPGISKAINDHGDAVKAHTRAVSRGMRQYAHRNGVEIIPDPPSTPPPPLPPTAAAGTLAVPAAPQPSRRDMRPAGNSGTRIVRFRDF